MFCLHAFDLSLRYAECWGATPYALEEVEGAEGADGELREGEELTRGGKRPCYDSGRYFVPEWGRTLSGAPNHARIRQLRAALMSWVGLRPGVTAEASRATDLPEPRTMPARSTPASYPPTALTPPIL